MDREKRSKLARAPEELPDAPGMARAFLVVVLMVAITAILCVVIYAVMIAIRPIEARHYNKAAHIEHPAGDASRAWAARL